MWVLLLFCCLLFFGHFLSLIPLITSFPFHIWQVFWRGHGGQFPKLFIYEDINTKASREHIVTETPVIHDLS